MKRAFTLIELLVVIAIIAILAAILFPVFAQAKAAAKSAATLSNVKQLGLAIHMYSNDYDDITPLYEYTVNDPDPRFMSFGELMYPYVKNNQIFFDAATGVLSPDEMRVQAQNYGDWIYFHNISLNSGGLFGYWTTDSGYKYGRSLAAQENLSQRAAMMTTEYPGVGGAYGYYQFLNWVALNPNYDNPSAFWENLTYNAAKRHNNSNMVAYADGHAGRAKAGAIYNPKGNTDFWGWYGKPEVKSFWGYWYSATE